MGKNTIPTQAKNFLGLLLAEIYNNYELKQIIKLREQLEKEDNFEVITSEEFEILINNPDYQRYDSLNAALLGFKNKNTNIWKILPIEFMKNKLLI